MDAPTFREDAWQRPGGGGGRTRVIADGAVFEKGGVNFSEVFGEFSPEFAKQLPGDGLSFMAAGVSLVLHPLSPLVPTVHANFRHLTHGSKSWFGGGADLTPYYPVKEDVIHFHKVWKQVCDEHSTVADGDAAAEVFITLVRGLFHRGHLYAMKSCALMSASASASTSALVLYRAKDARQVAVHAEALHQRLGAVVAGADRHALRSTMVETSCGCSPSS